VWGNSISQSVSQSVRLLLIMIRTSRCFFAVCSLSTCKLGDLESLNSQSVMWLVFVGWCCSWKEAAIRINNDVSNIYTDVV
jgi:hypothetical protein